VDQVDNLVVRPRVIVLLLFRHVFKGLDKVPKLLLELLWNGHIWFDHTGIV
jgi:hypothetical protein